MIDLLRKNNVSHPANRGALHLGTFLPTETSVMSTMSTLEFSVIRLARLLPLSEVIAPPLTWSTTLVEKRIVWLHFLNYKYIPHIAWTFTWWMPPSSSYLAYIVTTSNARWIFCAIYMIACKSIVELVSHSLQLFVCSKHSMYSHYHIRIAPLMQ